MKEGSLIVFEQSAHGQALADYKLKNVENQMELFTYHSALIEPGDYGVICKLQKFDSFNHVLLADVLIGDTLIFDVDLSVTEISIVN